MKPNKQTLTVSLWLCIAALSLAPACGSSGNPAAGTGSTSALKNKVDDDKDGKTDEADEGKDEDEDGEVDEEGEHEDACKAVAGQPAPARAADDDDEGEDDALDCDDDEGEDDDDEVDDQTEQEGEHED